MKNVFLLIFLFFIVETKAQQSFIADADTTIYSKPARAPEFPGGFTMFDNYIDIQADKLLKSGHAQGMVVAAMVIEKDGSITKAQIIRGINSEIDAVALKFLKNSPLWKPGIDKGRPVRTAVKIGVKFRDPMFARIVRVPDVHLSSGNDEGVMIDEPLPPSSPEDSDPNKIFSAVETIPEFPGGRAKFDEYIDKNKKITVQPEEGSGRVIVSFIVEKDGKLTSIRVIRGISNACDAEAIRLLMHSPAWKPGLQAGKPVRVAYSTPIHFKSTN